LAQKTLWLAFAVLTLGRGAAAAAEETLLGDLRDVDHGGFGGPVVRLTVVDGDFGVMTGGRGGWIIDHRFVLGGGGYGLVTELETELPGPPDGSGNPTYVTEKIDVGYGGFIIEYVVASDRLIHCTFEGLIGAGGASTRLGDRDEAFFVAEPGANLVLNVTRFIRAGLGASYRYVGGLGLGELDSADLRGAAVVLSLKFGSF
jgi:hypothetical protein